MTIRGRISGLENDLGIVGKCPVCDGYGSEGGSVIIKPGEPEPEQEGCPGCGKIGTPQSVIVVHLDDDTPDVQD